MTASLADPTINTGEAVGDTYSSIEGLIGSDSDDMLIGDDNTNILRGGLGADALDGGGGSDYADYDTAVTASLADPTVNTGDAAGDTYTSIEGLLGSIFDDVLIGDDNDNSLRGGSGADVLNGGGGFDFALYDNSAVGLTVSLANPGTNTGDAAGDAFNSIEGLVGSDFNDKLFGDAGDNELRGGLGADILNGGSGNDTLTGGPGPDTFVFAPGYDADTVTDFSAAEGDRIDLTAFPAIASISQIRAIATQVGADTVLDFGNGDTLTLKNVTASGLTANDFLLVSTEVAFIAPILELNNFGADVAAGGWVSQDIYPRVLGDVNGDGRADIVGFGVAGAYTALGQADGSFVAPFRSSNNFGTSAAAGGWASQDIYPRILGDVNGDGRADIVGFGVAGAYTALGQADGSFVAAFLSSNNFGTDTAAGRLGEPGHLPAASWRCERRRPGRHRRLWGCRGLYRARTSRWQLRSRLSVVEQFRDGYGGGRLGEPGHLPAASWRCERRRPGRHRRLWCRWGLYRARTSRWQLRGRLSVVK